MARTLDVVHVIRPRLPWRERDLTECGLDPDKHPSITRDELAERHKTLGSQRLAMQTCMTCLTTRDRWPSWAESPIHCLRRELERSYRTAELLDAELRAIELLIAAHRDEFDAQVAVRLGEIEGVAVLRPKTGTG